MVEPRTVECMSMNGPDCFERAFIAWLLTLARWSDLDGIPLRGAAARAELRVPGDLAIVAYDNTPMTASPLIDLASVDQDGRAQGQLAARTLLDRIAGRRESQHLLVEPHLVARSSL
jgi:LacI family transcriptional regulator